jgi:hypothetical protein
MDFFWEDKTAFPGPKGPRRSPRPHTEHRTDPRRFAPGSAQDRPDTPRRHRPPRPPRRPGDPPAPLSFPRCPGHHQPPRHPDHHGPPHLLDVAAQARGGELERALAQAERLQLYDHRAIQDVIARSNGHQGTKTLANATRQEPKWTRNEWEAAFLDLLTASPTTTGPHTRSSSKPTAGRPTAPAPPFAMTAPRTRPSPRRASESSDSPRTSSPTSSSGASARCWRHSAPGPGQVALARGPR